ncbi:MAG: dihydrofolate reductase family protein [Candidatus Nanopelagicales bacterium]
MDDTELWEAYAWPERSLRVNFVTSMDGHIQGPDGKSGTLSSEEDRRIFHMLRAGCDAILVGAGTARIENYKEVSLKPEWAGLRGDSDSPALIMVSASGHVPAIEGALVVDGTDLAALKDRYSRILCEGGPHLFTALLEQGLVDELALSTSNHLGGTGALVTSGMWREAVPKHVHQDAEGVYSLWDVS